MLFYSQNSTQTKPIVSSIFWWCHLLCHLPHCSATYFAQIMSCCCVTNQSCVSSRCMIMSFKNVVIPPSSCCIVVHYSTIACGSSVLARVLVFTHFEMGLKTCLKHGRALLYVREHSSLTWGPFSSPNYSAHRIMSSDLS